MSKFLKERFALAGAHRLACRWDDAHAVLTEIASQVDELDQYDGDVVRTWIDIHSHLVEAFRSAASGREGLELHHLTHARYALEHLPTHEIDSEDEGRLQIELLHVELAWRELQLALQIQGLRRSPG